MSDVPVVAAAPVAPVASVGAGGLSAQQLFSSTLQPTRPASLLEPTTTTTTTANPSSNQGNSSSNTNSKWSNLGVDINVDNLMANRNDKQVRPSMNQLAACSGSRSSVPATGLMSPPSPLSFGSARIAPVSPAGQQPRPGFLPHNSSSSPTPPTAFNARPSLF